MSDIEVNASVVVKRMSSSDDGHSYEIEIREDVSRRRIIVMLTAGQLAGALTALVSECRVRIIDRSKP